MFFRPVSCPHCGAPIAEESIGRSIITCAYCKGTFAPLGHAVYRISFARSLAEAEARAPAPSISLRGRRFVPELELARSARAVTLLADAHVPTVERVILKLARDPAIVERERAVLEALAASSEAGHAHFATRVPQVVASGVAEAASIRVPAIAFRHRPGYLHTAADVRAAYPSGIDGRHLVWMWRRILEVVGFAHRSGWAHGALALDHLVVAARDHGVLVVGWSNAKGTSASASLADVALSAALVRSLSDGALPPPLAEVMTAAAAGAHADAWELAEVVGRAARRSYGPPAFHPFSLPPFHR